MPWNDVKFAFIYKSDLFAVDRICLYLGESPQKGITIDEEMQGWEEVANGLSQYLPGAKDMNSWWSDVVFPAFSANLTLVYKDPAYPDSDIQKMMEVPAKTPPSYVQDILRYLSSFLPWVLCFYSRIAGGRGMKLFILNILFWLGIILILPSFVVLAKAVARFLNWIELPEDGTIRNEFYGTLHFAVFVGLPVLLYAAAMIISLSVF